MNQNRGDLIVYWFVLVVILGGTIVCGIYMLTTGEYQQLFVSQNAFLVTWFSAFVIEGFLVLFSLMALYEARQDLKRYEPQLITLLRRIIDSRGFAHYLTNLAKNPGNDELLSGFNGQLLLAKNCLEMILWTANQTTQALLNGIVSDKIGQAMPARGREEEWKQLVCSFEKNLMIETN